MGLDLDQMSSPLFKLHVGIPFSSNSSGLPSSGIRSPAVTKMVRLFGVFLEWLVLLYSSVE